MSGVEIPSIHMIQTRIDKQIRCSASWYKAADRRPDETHDVWYDREKGWRVNSIPHNGGTEYRTPLIVTRENGAVYQNSAKTCNLRLMMVNNYNMGPHHDIALLRATDIIEDCYTPQIIAPYDAKSFKYVLTKPHLRFGQTPTDVESFITQFAALDILKL